jgi:hypothetical protein
MNPCNTGLLNGETLAPSTNFWLLVGTPENWVTAFDYGGIWGLRRSQERFWQRISENNDIAFFYVTSPVVGVVGYGVIRTKLRQDSPLWPEERAKNEIIWPLRFEFDVMSCLPPAAWRDQKFSSETLKGRARSGFQQIETSLAEEIMGALPASAPAGLVLAQPVGIRPRAQQPETILPAVENLHDRTQGLLVEIGRLQHFVADSEYPLENRRLDVVWRRVQRSVPSVVFEIQVGGNLTEAMGKLKHAFDLWNSNIFLVGKDEHRAPAEQLASGTFREIQPRLRFIELKQVEDLYQRKRAYRELESQLGIMNL